MYNKQLGLGRKTPLYRVHSYKLKPLYIFWLKVMSFGTGRARCARRTSSRGASLTFLHYYNLHLRPVNKKGSHAHREDSAAYARAGGAHSSLLCRFRRAAGLAL